MCDDELPINDEVQTTEGAIASSPKADQEPQRSASNTCDQHRLPLKLKRQERRK